MIEEQGKKGTEAHKAAVVGDTVGDPFKDTSGPSLNILLKLMSVVALVIAPSIEIDNESLKRYDELKLNKNQIQIDLMEDAFNNLDDKDQQVHTKLSFLNKNQSAK
tara:strand:- start:890 stop:1207 length:318 start_codon:yes stop_codon:yes gene_type:complete